MIPFRRRGVYQAMQNIIIGLGAISGAAFGGVITDTIGWRWCFVLQAPVSLLALGIGFCVLKDPVDHILELCPLSTFRSVLRSIDLSGATVLVFTLLVQLLGLSFGGNDFPWDSPPVIGCIAASVV